MSEKVSVFYNCDVEEGRQAGNCVMLKEEEVSGKPLFIINPKRAELQPLGNRLVNYSRESS